MGLKLNILASAVAALSLIGFSSAASAEEPSAPTVITVPVDSKVDQPPSSDFMSQSPINPDASQLKAESASSTNPSGSPDLSGTPVPSYRTLGAAAAAGVNPLAHLALASAQGGEPVTTSWVRHLLPYGLIALGFAVVLSVAYVVLSPRIRPVTSDETA
jgi:hypothetical protein